MTGEVLRALQKFNHMPLSDNGRSISKLDGHKKVVRRVTMAWRVHNMSSDHIGVVNRSGVGSLMVIVWSYPKLT